MDLAKNPNLPSYASPWDFLIALSRRLRCRTDQVPAARAMAELLTYLEQFEARPEAIPPAFLRTAALLLAKLSELPFYPCFERIEEVADHLKRLNHRRPEAAHWTQPDWWRLARVVLENRSLRTDLYFAADAPFEWDRERELELPFFARYVGEPLDSDRLQVPAFLSDSLLNEATSLIRTISDNLAGARRILEDLKELDAKLPPPGSPFKRRTER